MSINFASSIGFVYAFERLRPKVHRELSESLLCNCMRVSWYLIIILIIWSDLAHAGSVVFI